jgi:uncharacterized protein (DUF1697 family)
LTNHRVPSKSAVVTRMIALLRGINVGGANKVPMQALRALAEKLKFTDVSTYIASGNLLLTSALDAAATERALEAAIAKQFSLEIPVIVRTREQWSAYASGSPFADAERDRPNVLHLALSKKPLSLDAVATLSAYAKGGERLSALGDALWIDFNEGAARSKLTPSVLDRAAGSSVTARNFNSVKKIAELLG